jgi:hypothetical protein
LLCDEKTRLLDAYQITVDSYATAASTLSTTRGGRLAFKKAFHNAKLTRQAAKGAMLTLKHHKEKHGC